MSRDNIVWGKVVAVLLSEGWRPPKLNEDTFERIVDDMCYMHNQKTIKITERQYEVAKLMAIGYTRAEVAERLGVGQETVSTHLKRLHLNLGVTKTIHAVYLLAKQGLI